MEVKKNVPWAKLITDGVISDEEEQYFSIIKERHTIGRRKDSDVLVSDTRASGTHCIILRRGRNGGPTLMDTSTNGTLLNGKQLDKNTEVELVNQDCISIIQGKEAPEHNVVYRFVDLRDSEEVDATLNYEQDNTLEINLEEDLEEGEREEASGQEKGKREEGYHMQRKRRKRKLEHTGAPEAIKLCVLASDDVLPHGITEPSTSITEKDSIEETLICQICQEIMHACVSLQPCMHSYCGGCYSDWMVESRTCPACRKKVKRISRNHIINNLVDAYIRDNPSKKRLEEDLWELDAKNKITHDMKYSNMRCCFNQPEHNDSGDSDSDSSSGHSTWSNSSSTTSSSIHRLNLRSFCLQCPGNVGIVSSPALSSSLRNFTCSSSTLHTMCQCCLRAMPLRDDDANIVQQCELCRGFYCHLYWGCTKPGCLGCIAQFKDLNLHTTCLNGILGNAYESNILKSYLESKSFSIRDFVQELCAWMGGSGIHVTSVTPSHTHITPDTYVCHGCGLRALKDLAYHYRKAIPKEDLPTSVTEREDCHWGKECHTQFNKPAHAMKFNHVCERTRQS